jgi:HK97 family phage major capsid protein
MENKELEAAFALKADEAKKAFDTKSAAIEKAFEEKKAELENAIALKASTDEVETLKGKLNEVGIQFDELHKQVNTKGSSNVEKSFSDQIGESLKLQKDAIDLIKSNSGAGKAIFNVNLNTKAAGTITSGNYSGGTVGLTSFDPMFARVVKRQPFLRQLVNVQPVSTKYVAWAEQAALDGGAGNTAEGAAKTQSDFDIVESSKLVEKITSYIKVSKEALDDIAFLQSEINNELVDLVNLKLDADILGGSGTTPVMKGILGYATTYVPASPFALAVDNASNFDVIRAVVAVLANTNYEATAVVINPLDAGMMDLVKVSATDGRYVLPPFYSADGQRIAGLPVVTNSGMTAGTFLIGDFKKSNLAMREEINIQVGYENDDFTKNLVTILAEVRATHYIKTNHAGAFYKGTFATIKAQLETA